MAEFTIEIAGCRAAVTSLFASTRDYCGKYLTEGEPHFRIAVTRQDLTFEQEALRQEALEEGIRVRMFTDPFLKLTAGGVLACGSPWSGKHGLDSNITIPLQGICILERGQENHIQRITAEEALPMLLHQSYCPLEPSKRGRFEELVQQLAEKTPLWHMHCNMSPEAPLVSHRAMGKSC